MTKVYVGLSGGVDSSVAAALLKEQGYEVTGVYMKNWTRDVPGMKCPWAEDLADAKRVAVQLGIGFEVFDFETAYKQKVVDYMIEEYKAGRTPNPDVMCNQEVKFKLFLAAALQEGADMIATGHYARVAYSNLNLDRKPLPRTVLRVTHFPTVLTSFRAVGAPPNSALDKLTAGVGAVEGAISSGAARLLVGLDASKDQSYFLYRVTEQALERTLMPIGEYEKSKIRELAAERRLITAAKKDSQGICFVGKIGMKDFLRQYITSQPGPIINVQTGQEVGQHEGAIFYTLGQRQGLGVGGGLPFYVVGKDMEQNIVFVTTKLNAEQLWQDKVQLTSLHWINDPPALGQIYKVRSRYRAPLASATVKALTETKLTLTLAQAERAITPGQSTVLYEGERVVGGGVVV